MARNNYKAYVVFKAHEGHRVGVYLSWAEAKRATSGIAGAPQGFKTEEEARRAFDTGILQHPNRFYVIEGRSRIFQVFERAVIAAEGLGVDPSGVYRFDIQADAEAYAARQQPSVPLETAESGAPRQLVGDAVNRRGRVIVFDTETTGLDSSTDQIVQLAICVYDEGTFVRSKNFFFRPTNANMSEGAQAIHGITMEMLADKPTFEQKAREIYNTFMSANCLMGYNVRFDIGMLRAEFHRVNLDSWRWQDYTILDPYQIWLSRERRNLTGAHRRFVGHEMENAHNAADDVHATARVYNAMMNHFDMSRLSAEEISTEIRGRKVDLEGKFVWNENYLVVFTFGMYKGQSPCDPEKSRYLGWIRSHDFPEDTRRIVQIASDNIDDRDEFHRLVISEFGEPTQEQPTT